MSKAPTHRGADPEDAKLFAPAKWPDLGRAVEDLCWLLDRGYAAPSAVELVGNRYALTRRQRIGVCRCSCSEAARQRRREHEFNPAQGSIEELWLDGFNVLMAVESALAGGVLLGGRDRCYRDMASVHARYRTVEETRPALRLIGEGLAAWPVRQCCWWLDRPVSNSGRLKHIILDLAADAGWDWRAELVFNPDKILASSKQIVASSDSVILDECERWINLARWLIDQRVPRAWIVDLAAPAMSMAPGSAR
jgi:hypothetical protein